MENTKTKVLFIITKSNFGGAQRHVFDLATNLPKEKFTAVVAAGGRGALLEKLEAAGIKTISISSLGRDLKTVGDALSFRAIYKIIKEEKPEIVHLHSSKVGIIGSLATRLYNLANKFLHSLNATRYTLHPSRIVFTAHGWAFKEKRRPILKKLIEYGSWLTIASSHKTIVVSGDDLEKVRRFIFVQSKIHLVHNGIETPTFRERADARKIIAEKIGRRVPDDAILLGTIAELTKNKGLDYAIEALKTVPNCLYVIISDGEDKEKLQKKIVEAGLGEKVFLAGQIENAASLLKVFDIFLLPSLKEGLPYALLEAGFAGLPVIATNVGGIPEVIEDMKSGIVVRAKRPKEISDAVRFLMTHQKKSKEFGELLAGVVQKEFTLAGMITKTVAIYETLLSHKD